MIWKGSGGKEDTQARFLDQRDILLRRETSSGLAVIFRRLLRALRGGMPSPLAARRWSLLGSLGYRREQG
jgi:hypothetical protein